MGNKKDMFGQSKEQQIDDQIYNLKYMSKTLKRTADSQLKLEREYNKRAKKALRAGDERIAVTYIRQSQQYAELALKTTQMACNVEVIGAKVVGAIQSGQMNDDILHTVSLLTSSIRPDKAMDKIGSMDKMFDDILVYSGSVADAMDGIVAPSSAASLDEVNMLADMKNQITQDVSMDLMSLPSIGGSALPSVTDGGPHRQHNSYF